MSFWWVSLLACAKQAEMPWEDLGPESSPMEERQASEVPPLLGEPIGEGEWHDIESTLSVTLTDGWIAWPGTPGALVRVHLHHSKSATALRVFKSSNPLNWPASSDCVWTFTDSGAYAGLQGIPSVEYGSCWPGVPGGLSKIAWRFVSEQAHWMIEAQLMGGKVGLAHESIAELIGAMTFKAP